MTLSWSFILQLYSRLFKNAVPCVLWSLSWYLDSSCT